MKAYGERLHNFHLQELSQTSAMIAYCLIHNPEGLQQEKEPLACFDMEYRVVRNQSTCVTVKRNVLPLSGIEPPAMQSVLSHLTECNMYSYQM